MERLPLMSSATSSTSFTLECIEMGGLLKKSSLPHSYCSAIWLNRAIHFGTWKRVWKYLLRVCLSQLLSVFKWVDQIMVKSKKNVADVDSGDRYIKLLAGNRTQCLDLPRCVKKGRKKKTTTRSNLFWLFFSAPGGDLQTLMDDDMVPYERDAVKFVRQVLEGLLFLHERSMAHLDIKVKKCLSTPFFRRDTR